MESGDVKGYARVKDLINNFHNFDMILSSFDLIVLKAYLQYDKRKDLICLLELYKHLEEMIKYIKGKYPNYYKIDNKEQDNKKETEDTINKEDIEVIDILNNK